MILKYSVYIIIFAIFLLPGCFENDSYDSIKEDYLANKEKIQEIVKIFDELPSNIWNIARSDDSFANIISCNFTKRTYRYSIITKNGTKFYNYIIIINGEDAEDEEKFWKQDYSKIKNKDNTKLSTFLEDNKIPENSFRKIRDFLYEKKYTSLSREDSNIEFRFASRAGIIYSQNNEHNNHIYGDSQEFKRIDSHCYYFYTSDFP